MSKISVTEAKKLLIELEIELVDAFASLVKNKVEEDAIKLETYTNLINKIYQAEKHFCIDDMRNTMSNLTKQISYYNPINAVFYYKEKISDELKDSNTVIYNELNTKLDLLSNKIAEICEHIYIRVD
jgi:hypothetical protein